MIGTLFIIATSPLDIVINEVIIPTLYSAFKQTGLLPYLLIFLLIAALVILFREILKHHKKKEVK